jgi:hypothetical protein
MKFQNTGGYADPPLQTHVHCTGRSAYPPADCRNAIFLAIALLNIMNAWQMRGAIENSEGSRNEIEYGKEAGVSPPKMNETTRLIVSRILYVANRQIRPFPA